MGQGKKKIWASCSSVFKGRWPFLSFPPLRQPSLFPMATPVEQAGCNFPYSLCPQECGKTGTKYDSLVLYPPELLPVGGKGSPLKSWPCWKANWKKANECDSLLFCSIHCHQLFSHWEMGDQPIVCCWKWALFQVVGLGPCLAKPSFAAGSVFAWDIDLMRNTNSLHNHEVACK